MLQKDRTPTSSATICRCLQGLHTRHISPLYLLEYQYNPESHGMLSVDCGGEHLCRTKGLQIQHTNRTCCHMTNTVPYQEVWIHLQHPVHAESADAQHFVQIYHGVCALYYLS